MKTTQLFSASEKRQSDVCRINQTVKANNFPDDTKKAIAKETASIINNFRAIDKEVFAALKVDHNPPKYSVKEPIWDKGVRKIDDSPVQLQTPISQELLKLKNELVKEGMDTIVSDNNDFVERNEKITAAHDSIIASIDAISKAVNVELPKEKVKVKPEAEEAGEGEGEGK